MKSKSTNASPKAQRLTTPRQVGDILRSRRQAKGLSQADVASKLGVSQARLSVAESKPETLTVERLIALATLLDLEGAGRASAHSAGAVFQYSACRSLLN